MEATVVGGALGAGRGAGNPDGLATAAGAVELVCTTAKSSGFRQPTASQTKTSIARVSRGTVFTLTSGSKTVTNVYVVSSVPCAVRARQVQLWILEVGQWYAHSVMFFVRTFASMRSWASVSAVALVCSSCAQFKAKPVLPFRVEVHVDGDEGLPLAGASVSVNGSSNGVTDPNGLSAYESLLPDGTALTFEVICPKDTVPVAPFSAKVLRTEDRRALSYKVACKATSRSIVIAIRAENGPDLPVRYYDQVVGRTDRSGAAHLSLRVPVGDPFSIRLDTSENDKIKPKDPKAQFVADGRDDVKVFNVKFEVEKKKVPVYIKPKRTGPKEI
jgi:hypothetical protein